MRHCNYFLSIPISFSWLLTACGEPPGAVAVDDVNVAIVGLVDGQGEKPPGYVDMEETFTVDEDWSRWFDVRLRLRQAFDQVCGDTFCEGDYSNLQALSLRCSVSTRTGQLKSCLWLFAGSSESVNPSTGYVRSGAKAFACRFTPAGAPRLLLDALATGEGWDLLQKPLPGGTSSLYDVLMGCL